MFNQKYSLPFAAAVAAATSGAAFANAKPSQPVIDALQESQICDSGVSTNAASSS
jgi:hypothetical protein